MSHTSPPAYTTTPSKPLPPASSNSTLQALKNTLSGRFFGTKKSVDASQEAVAKLSQDVDNARMMLQKEGGDSNSNSASEVLEISTTHGGLVQTFAEEETEITTCTISGDNASMECSIRTTTTTTTHQHNLDTDADECTTTTTTEKITAKREQPYCVPVTLDELKPGDHIYVTRTLYQHHGIYIGKTDRHEHGVVHFCPVDATIDEKSSENCVIQETDIDRFILDSKCIYRKVYGVSYLEYLWKRKGTTSYMMSECAERVIERAKSRIGEKNYQLHNWNCEHFSHWCVTGNSVASDQVRGVVAGVGTAVIGTALAGAAALGVASYALYRVMSGSGGRSGAAVAEEDGDSK